MNKTKICPMFWASESLSRHECKEKECGWWDDTHDKCSIVQLAQSSTGIKEQLRVKRGLI